jgi:hypothetical protein
MAIIKILPLLIPLLLSGPTTLGQPVHATANSDVNTSMLTRGTPTWGRFCDDTNCSVNCGMWVNVANTGCLQGEAARQSFLWQDPSSPSMLWWSLVVTAGPSCGCQSACQSFKTDDLEMLPPGCVALESRGESYRWIAGECPDDNC